MIICYEIVNSITSYIQNNETPDLKISNHNSTIVKLFRWYIKALLPVVSYNVYCQYIVGLRFLPWNSCWKSELLGKNQFFIWTRDSLVIIFHILHPLACQNMTHRCIKCCTSVSCVSTLIYLSFLKYFKCPLDFEWFKITNDMWCLHVLRSDNDMWCLQGSVVIGERPQNC